MKKKNIKFERHKVRKPVSETHKKSMDNRNICKSNGITDDEQEESKNFGIQNENSRLDASIVSDKNILLIKMILNLDCRAI